MKKENIHLILAGAGVLVALAVLPKGEGKDGSESGGFQLPSFFPTGAGAGDAAAAPAATYNISFPDFPGWPSATGGDTKKEGVTYSATAAPWKGVSQAAALSESKKVVSTPTSTYSPTMAIGTGAVTPLSQVSQAWSTIGRGGGGKNTGGMGKTTPSPATKKKVAPAVRTTTPFGTSRGW
jgi:hypothetical protein